MKNTEFIDILVEKIISDRHEKTQYAPQFQSEIEDSSPAYLAFLIGKINKTHSQTHDNHSRNEKFKKSSYAKIKSETSHTHASKHKRLSDTSVSIDNPPENEPIMCAHDLSPEQKLALEFFNRYTKLSLEFGAPELKKAFRKVALKVHPDRKGGSSREFLELQKAFSNLSSLFI